MTSQPEVNAKTAEQERLVVSVDQGTSSTRVIVFSTLTGEVTAVHQIQVNPAYPASGWIELDADELYSTTLGCLNECASQLQSQGRSLDDIVSLGVSNQRETTIAWDRTTGKPLAPAIVWSDARTADLVRQFTRQAPGQSPNAFQQKTGLPLHSYFSALKLCWLLENDAAVAEANRNGTLLVGTVDCWLIWRLTMGKSHVTDVTNASRTMLFNLHTLNWDPELCRFFKIDVAILPKIVSSSEVVGTITDPACTMGPVKIAGILGDQQASLVAQTWNTSVSSNNAAESRFGPTVKVTYGTGAFMLWDIGTAPFFSKNGILTTVAFKMGPNAPVHYALEGSVAFAGATIGWLRNKLSLFSDYEELEDLARECHVNRRETEPDPCYLVPAFTGLFCPWWQETARALLAGLTADVDRGAVIYAAIRSAVYQTYDVLRVATLAEASSTTQAALQKPREIVVDGGMANSAVLMQSLADILDMTVRRHNHSEMMTALGAALAAAVAVGVDPSGLLKLRDYPETDRGQTAHCFSASIMPHARQLMLTGWHAAVTRSLGWVESSSPDETEDSLCTLLHNTAKEKTGGTAKHPTTPANAESGDTHRSLWSTRVVLLAATMLAIGFVLGRHKLL